MNRQRQAEPPERREHSAHHYRLQAPHDTATPSLKQENLRLQLARVLPLALQQAHGLRDPAAMKTPQRGGTRRTEPATILTASEFPRGDYSSSRGFLPEAV